MGYNKSKKIFIIPAIFILLFINNQGIPAERLPVSEDNPQAESAEALCIAGLVQNPVFLTSEDLSGFRQAAVKSGKSKNKNSVLYTGIPVRMLLDLVKIHKNDPAGMSDKKNKTTEVNTDSNDGEGAGIKNNSDIAVSFKNKEGKQMIFSWGEIFLRAENEFVLINNRNSRLPELAVKKGHGLKEVTFIEVLQVPAFREADKDNALPYIVYGENNISLTEALEKCEPTNVRGGNTKKFPDNASSVSYKDFSLQMVLNDLLIKPEYTDIFTVLSYNGDSASFSSAEIVDPNFPIIIRQNRNGDQDSYDITVTGDKSTVRCIKNISRIIRNDLKQKPVIYVIGMGCGDAGLLTNEAVTYMGRADAFICMSKYRFIYAGYMGGKPVLFDPFLQLAAYYNKKHPDLSKEEAEKGARDVYNNDMQMIRDALDQGRTVALLEPGDPTIFGGWRNWLSPNFPSDKIIIIPGISSFTASNAMLGEYDMTETSVIITEPENLKRDDSIIKAAAKSQSTLVIFMDLTRMKDLAPVFSKYFDEDTPVHLVYYAGIANKKTRIKTTLEKAVEEIEANNDKFPGLIYIGRKL